MPQCSSTVVRGFAKQLPLRCLALGVMVIGVLGSVSCAGKGKKLYPVYGKVLYKGQPAEGAEVIFHPENDNNPYSVRPTGRVGGDGTFQLTSYEKDDGAPAGRYYVFVVWIESRMPETIRQEKRPAPTSKAKPEQADIHKPAKENIPGDWLKGRYTNHHQPRFRVTIQPEKNELAPFEIEK